jgi:hypothetical protein
MPTAAWTRRSPLTSVLETRHTDAIVLLGDLQVQPRLLADLRPPACRWSASWQGTSPIEFPTAGHRRPAGIRAGLEHLESLGHRRIAFLSADLPVEYRVREDAYADFMRDRFEGVPAGYLGAVPQHPGRRRRRPAAPAGPARAANGRWRPRPTWSPSAPCTPPTASAPPCPTALGGGLRRHPDRQPHRARAQPPCGCRSPRSSPTPSPWRSPWPGPDAVPRAQPRGLQAHPDRAGVDRGPGGRAAADRASPVSGGSTPASPRPPRLAQAKYGIGAGGQRRRAVAGRLGGARSRPRTTGAVTPTKPRPMSGAGPRPAPAAGPSAAPRAGSPAAGRPTRGSRPAGRARRRRAAAHGVDPRVGLGTRIGSSSSRTTSSPGLPRPGQLGRSPRPPPGRGPVRSAEHRRPAPPGHPQRQRPGPPRGASTTSTVTRPSHG